LIVYFEKLFGVDFVAEPLVLTSSYRLQIKKLFRKMSAVRHCLHALLPKRRHNKILNSLRGRGHNYVLPHTEVTLFKTVLLIDVFLLYLSVCWTAVIDIVCFVLFAVCLFFTVCCLCLRAFVMLLMKGNLLQHNDRNNECLWNYWSAEYKNLVKKKKATVETSKHFEILQNLQTF